MKIALGMDHRGVDVGRVLTTALPGEGHEVQVLDSCDEDSCDYPDVTWPVAKAVAAGEADRGILVCGTGIGDETTAERSRRHNEANGLCLAGDGLTDDEQILRIVTVWLATPFDGGRHARRVNKIAAIERRSRP